MFDLADKTLNQMPLSIAPLIILMWCFGILLGEEVRRRAVAIKSDPDEVDSVMYRLVMAVLKDAFGKKSE